MSETHYSLKEMETMNLKSIDPASDSKMSETHYSLKEMETFFLPRCLQQTGSIIVRNPLLSERDGNYIYIVQVLFIRSMLSETHYSLKEMETFLLLLLNNDLP